MQDYEINGYSDGDLSRCTSCNVVSGAGGWNGKFGAYSGTCGWWRAAEGDPAKSFDGHAFNDTLSRIILSGSKWRMQLYCNDSSFNNYKIWSGEKATGSTPAGTYTRTGGCETTPTSLNIQEV